MEVCSCAGRHLLGDTLLHDQVVLQLYEFIIGGDDSTVAVKINDVIAKVIITAEKRELIGVDGGEVCFCEIT